MNGLNGLLLNTLGQLTVAGPDPKQQCEDTKIAADASCKGNTDPQCLTDAKNAYDACIKAIPPTIPNLPPEVIDFVFPTAAEIQGTATDKAADNLQRIETNLQSRWGGDVPQAITDAVARLKALAAGALTNQNVLSLEAEILNADADQNTKLLDTVLASLKPDATGVVPKPLLQAAVQKLRGALIAQVGPQAAQRLAGGDFSIQSVDNNTGLGKLINAATDKDAAKKDPAIKSLREMLANAGATATVLPNQNDDRAIRGYYDRATSLAGSSAPDAKRALLKLLSAYDVPFAMQVAMANEIDTLAAAAAAAGDSFDIHNHASATKLWNLLQQAQRYALANAGHKEVLERVSDPAERVLLANTLVRYGLRNNARGSKDDRITQNDPAAKQKAFDAAVAAAVKDGKIKTGSEPTLAQLENLGLPIDVLAVLLPALDKVAAVLPPHKWYEGELNGVISLVDGKDPADQGYAFDGSIKLTSPALGKRWRLGADFGLGYELKYEQFLRDASTVLVAPDVQSAEFLITALSGRVAFGTDDKKNTEVLALNGGIRLDPGEIGAVGPGLWLDGKYTWDVKGDKTHVLKLGATLGWMRQLKAPLEWDEFAGHAMYAVINGGYTYAEGAFGVGLLYAYLRQFPTEGRSTNAHVVAPKISTDFGTKGAVKLEVKGVYISVPLPNNTDLEIGKLQPTLTVRLPKGFSVAGTGVYSKKSKPVNETATLSGGPNADLEGVATFGSGGYGGAVVGWSTDDDNFAVKVGFYGGQFEQCEKAGGDTLCTGGRKLFLSDISVHVGF